MSHRPATDWGALGFVWVYVCCNASCKVSASEAVKMITLLFKTITNIQQKCPHKTSGDKNLNF